MNWINKLQVIIEQYGEGLITEQEFRDQFILAVADAPPKDVGKFMLRWATIFYESQ